MTLPITRAQSRALLALKVHTPETRYDAAPLDYHRSAN
jgi:hypothetical protein